MGFLKFAGTGVGLVFGVVVGVPVSIVGNMVGSKFVEEIGEGVMKASVKSGELAGGFADGAIKTAAGLAVDNKTWQRDGCSEMGATLTETAVGVGSSLVKTFISGCEVIDGAIHGDMKLVKTGGASIVKTVAIGALALGVLDIIDAPAHAVDIDISDVADDHPTAIADATDAPPIIENTGDHYVTPHLRQFADGETTWVDGDGDATTDTNAGWYQRNPTHKA